VRKTSKLRHYKTLQKLKLRIDEGENVDWQASRIHLDHLFTVAVTTRDSERSKLGVEPQGKNLHRMMVLESLLDDLVSHLAWATSVYEATCSSPRVETSVVGYCRVE